MSRIVPAQLVDHYATGRTSICHLVKIKRFDGVIYGFTTLDREVKYTDGPDGEITYSPTNGIRLSEQVSASDLSVDSSQVTGWVRDLGITEQQIRSGIFDGARWYIFEVNYFDLDAGHVLKNSGRTGEVKFGDSAWTLEFRSRKQLLRQPIRENFDKTCTVKYGSPACGKEFEWFNATINTVDSQEPDRIFTVTGGIDWPGGSRFTGGVLEIITGDNAGNQMDVETHSGSSIELLLHLPYIFESGDQVRLRIDCNKQARDEVFGCKSELRWGAEWVRHHRGFPDIPTADQAALLYPGAQIDR